MLKKACREAFAVRPGQAQCLAPEDRVKVW